MKKIIIFFTIIFLSITAYAATYNITFQWDRNIEPDLAGYKLYKSNRSGIYGNPAATIPDPNSFQYTLQTETTGKLYFVITAYDTSGNESAYSNEVTFEADANAPLKPTMFNIKNISIIIN